MTEAASDGLLMVMMMMVVVTMTKRHSECRRPISIQLVTRQNRPLSPTLFICVILMFVGRPRCHDVVDSEPMREVVCLRRCFLSERHVGVLSSALKYLKNKNLFVLVSKTRRSGVMGHNATEERLSVSRSFRLRNKTQPFV
ncbi:hypothetical protein ABVT39_009457 [Epinephelus coioides]